MLLIRPDKERATSEEELSKVILTREAKTKIKNPVTLNILFPCTSFEEEELKEVCSKALTKWKPFVNDYFKKLI